MKNSIVNNDEFTTRVPFPSLSNGFHSAAGPLPSARPIHGSFVRSFVRLHSGKTSKKMWKWKIEKIKYLQLFPRPWYIEMKEKWKMHVENIEKKRGGKTNLKCEWLKWNWKNWKKRMENAVLSINSKPLELTIKYWQMCSIVTSRGGRLAGAKWFH